MYSVTSKFLEAITLPHQLVTQVDVFYDGTNVLPDIAIKEGEVTVDRGSDIRRSATLSIGDPTLIPNTSDDPLLPFGSEVTIKRGVRYSDGSVELIPLGVFRIDSIESHKPDNAITLQMSDRWAGLADDRFTAPMAATAGALVTDEIKRIFRLTYPAVPIVELFASARTVPAGLVFEDERGDAINYLATSVEAECYFDPLGQFVIAPAARLNPATPVWDVMSGQNGVLVSVQASSSREEVYNCVVAYGEELEDKPAPRATAKITTGRLRWGGPFGRVTLYFSSPLITTTAQAQSSANTLRDSYNGLPRLLTFDSIVNPALEAGDSVRVVSVDGSTDVHLLTSFSVPLVANSGMSAETTSAPFPTA